MGEYSNWRADHGRTMQLGRTYDGRTQQLEDRPWEDTAIRGQIMGGHGNWRTRDGRTQQLEDTSWEDTAIGGHTMGEHSNWRADHGRTR